MLSGWVNTVEYKILYCIAIDIGVIPLKRKINEVMSVLKTFQ